MFFEPQRREGLVEEQNPKQARSTKLKIQKFGFRILCFEIKI